MLEASVVFLALTLTFWIVPILVLLWITYPDVPVRPIRIGVLALSVLAGLVYYRANRNRFPTTADKVTYWGFVLLGPVGVLAVFL